MRAMAEINKNTIPTNSAGGNVSEIQSLTARVQDLQRSFDFWNTWYVWLVAVTVFLAFVVFFTQFMSIRRGKQLTQAQSALAATKEQQLASELKEKDQKISEAGERASAADQRAGEANERAAALEATAERLRKENLSRQAEVLNLQGRLAPRRITQEQLDRFVAILRPYAGSVVRMTQLGDLEAGTFADDIVFVLSASHWVPQLTRVGIMAPPPYGLRCVVDDRTPAGKDLTEVLKSLPTAFVESAPVPGAIANIIVGLRPPP